MINSLYMLHFLTTSFSFFSFLIHYVVYRLWKSNTQVLRGQYFLMANLFYIAAHFRGYIFPMEGGLCYRSKFFKPRLTLYFLSPLALIIQELGLGDKGK